MAARLITMLVVLVLRERSESHTCGFARADIVELIDIRAQDEDLRFIERQSELKPLPPAPGRP